MTRPSKRNARGDRRTAIASSAIRVLAGQGARGLTHRAVDDDAGLAQGSTSYYFRTREALLGAAAAHLAEVDAKDVAEAVAGAGLPMLIARWTSASHRHHLMARFELFLEAARNPKTRALLRGPRRSFVEAARGAFRHAGSPDADLRGDLLVATIDGILLGHLIGPRRSPDELRTAVRLAYVSLGRSRSVASRRKGRM
jgi:AcrR family transcriptional regulator